MAEKTPDRTRTADSAEHSLGVRIGRDLLNATEPFAKEVPGKSWRAVLTVFTLLVGTLTAAGTAPWPWLQLTFSLLGAMLMVRTFITYHDYMHGSILAHASVAKGLFWIYGLLLLVPPPSWQKSHNYHHGHVGKIDPFGVGTFPVMTAEMWRSAPPLHRAYYRLQRHPLIILFGYITVFALGLCIIPFCKHPWKNIDSLISLLMHSAVIVALWQMAGPDVAFFAVLLPMTIACAFGSYLFFAQHSFKRMTILTPQAWNYYRASLGSSSYMPLNRFLQWITGNIGYHHIHHLNVRIPFYRLPEAMQAIPELQTPITTSLELREMRNCFRCNLWDEQKQRMVSYREAKAA